MPKSSLSTPLTDSWLLCFIGTVTSLNSCRCGLTCAWNILLFLCYNIGGRCCLSLQVLLILNTNIIRMVKVANSIECNGKHILKANYLITPFWNVPICSCLSFTCPLLWPIFPHFLQTIDFDYLGSLKLFLDSSFLLFLDFFGLPRAILITSGSITSVCKGGHKFGPLHG